jgi:integrase
MELLLFTGMRRSDVVRVGWGDVQDGAIRYTTQKSQYMANPDAPRSDALP